MLQRILNISNMLILGLLFVFSMQQIFQSFYKTNKPQEIKYYVDLLQKEVDKRDLKFDLSKAEYLIVPQSKMLVRNKRVIGLCFLNPLSNKKVILLEEKFWYKASDTTRLFLLAHESIGHCFGRLSHDDSYFNIMNSSMSETSVLTDSLLEDLITQVKRKHPNQ